MKKYKNFNNEFKKIIPKNRNIAQETQKIWEIFSYNLQDAITSIILVGYDTPNHYSSFYEFNMIYNDVNGLVYEDVDSSQNKREPDLKVFAINEEAYSFITGVNEEFIKFIMDDIRDKNEEIINNSIWELKEDNVKNTELIRNNLLKANNRLIHEINKDIKEFRKDTIEYTSYSLELLPSLLLCIFGELLVRLTAVKQKTSSEIESVSISTDIVVLSK